MTTIKYLEVSILPRKSIDNSSHGLSGQVLTFTGSDGLIGETDKQGIQFFTFVQLICQ